MTEQTIHGERINEWPRCHTCLYDWCSKKHEECWRCDAIYRLLIEQKKRSIHGEAADGTKR